jgi:hypothetical protein
MRESNARFILSGLGGREENGSGGREKERERERDQEKSSDFSSQTFSLRLFVEINYYLFVIIINIIK